MNPRTTFLVATPGEGTATEMERYQPTQPNRDLPTGARQGLHPTKSLAMGLFFICHLWTESMMPKSKSLTLIGVLACLSAGGCVSKRHVVEATITDHKTGKPAADVQVYGCYEHLGGVSLIDRRVTDENGRVKVVLPERDGQIHVLNLRDQAQVLPPEVPNSSGWQRLKGFLMIGWVRGNVFRVDETAVREGGCLPYDPTANNDRPVPFYTVSLTPVLSQTPLERVLDRLGIVWVH